jgi:hypothetical protein
MDAVERFLRGELAVSEAGEEGNSRVTPDFPNCGS